MTRAARVSDEFDENNILRDGKSVRVSMQARDAAMSRHRGRVTDGRSNDPMSLHRPGFRVPVVNDRRAVRDAYSQYETGLVNAYRVGDGTQCPTCFGSGKINGEDCDDCDSSGVMPERKSTSKGGGKGFGGGNEGHRSEDSRSVTRDQAYRDYDQALSSAWQNGRTG